VSTLGIKDYIGRIYFYPTNIFLLEHNTSSFQVVLLRQKVVGLIFGQLIVNARPKIDTQPYKFIINTSKIADFKAEFHFFRQILAENL